jgi:hypothetical protein
MNRAPSPGVPFHHIGYPGNQRRAGRIATERCINIQIFPITFNFQSSRPITVVE